MIDCLVLGDSIAVGVGQARPACITAARTGITSGAYLQAYGTSGQRPAREVVISLGVNDDPSMDTLANLRRLRRGVQADRVTWLLPGLKDNVRRVIQSVAAEHADRLVDTRSQVGPDRLHPSGEGYRTIAAWTQTGAPQLGGPTPIRTYTLGPMLIPMPRSNTAFRNGSGLPQIHTPSQTGSLYGAWPPTAANFAAIPPRDFAYRAFAAGPSGTAMR